MTGRGIHKLKAASVLEAIVASIVFLLIFVISTDVVTRIATRRTDMVLLEMEQSLNDVVGRYRTEWRNQGNYTERYDWGEIEIKVIPYRGYDNMNQVEFRTLPDRSGRTISHTILVCRD